MRWIFAPGTTCYLPLLSKYADNVSYHNGIRKLDINHPNSLRVIGRHSCVKFAEIDNIIRWPSFRQSNCRVDNNQTDNKDKTKVASQASHQPPHQLPHQHSHQHGIWFCYQCWYCCLRCYCCQLFIAMIDTLSYFWCMMVDRWQAMDTKGFYYNIHFDKYNFGQAADIQAVHRTYCQAKLTSDSIILYGVSRGSVALVNWLHSLTSQTSTINTNSTTNINDVHQTVKAIILESCLAEVDDMVKYATGYSNWLHAKLMTWLLTWYCSYQHLAEYQTINNITSLPKHIPILLITSKADRLVPVESVTRLYQHLQVAGYNNVHLCVLEHSSHKGYVTDNQQDRLRYLAAINHIYQLVGDTSRSTNN